MRLETIWLVVVVYPLWAANQLAGSPAEQLTDAFLWVVVPIVPGPVGLCVPNLSAATPISRLER